MANYDFDAVPDHVAQYENGPPVFVPGYEASQYMAATILAQRTSDRAHILVNGAGGGLEMAQFARLFPEWHFTAVDPSKAMLDQARDRMTAQGHGSRATFHQGTSLEAPDGPFDGATAFLCMMFEKDEQARLEQLKAIRRRLRPGAPFLMLHAAVDAEKMEAGFERFRLHAKLRGAPADLIAIAEETNRSHLVFRSPADEYQMLVEAGFAPDGLFFKGLWIQGWEATA